MSLVIFMAISHIVGMGLGDHGRGVLALLSVVWGASLPWAAKAQDVSTQPTSAPDMPVLAIPALTPVEIVVDAELGSKTSTTGQMFPLHLGAAIIVDGKELVPAGTLGEGEIVHAKKAGGSGAPGELVVAARYLQLGGKRLKLRSMRIGLVGKDAVNGVVAFNAVTAVTPLPIGIIGFAVTGRNVVYPAGTTATAKTAEGFVVAQSGDSAVRAGAAPADSADVSTGAVAGE
jgi:hypothetical protein